MSEGECYLCRSNNYRLIFQKSKYSIVKCLNCDFVFTTPLPNKREVDNFYKQFDYKDILSSEKVIRSDAKRSLAKISRHVSKKGDLLDVGCGRGYFLDEARRLGWNCQGVDVSALVTGYARNKLHLTIFQSDIFSFKLKQTFDLVTLNQIIEHFVNPKELINKCNEFLTPGGWLYIATPNVESISAKVLKDSFDHYIPPEHVGYFSQHTLRNLLENLGFDVIHVGSWSYPADLGGIIKALLGRKAQMKQLQPSSDKYPKITSYVSKLFNTKQIKSFVFDKVFCRFFYRVLNFDGWGTNLEMLAQKL